MLKQPSEAVLKNWRDDIKRNGVKRMKVRGLLRAFGAERRGAAISEGIKAWAVQQALYFNGFDQAETLDDVVSISDEPITRIGNLADSERALMDRFETEIAGQLDLLGPMVRDFRPDGCRDALDWICQDADRTVVIVELKLQGGDKRGVEQVLRYMRQVRADSRYEGREIRGVLVTGEGDLATRRALEQLTAGERIDWWIYGIHGSAIVVKREVVKHRAQRASAGSAT